MRNSKDKSKLNNSGDQTPHVKIRSILLRGFPLTSVKVTDLEIESSYSFSTLEYTRPEFKSSKATCLVEIISPAGDVITQSLELDFKYTEAERIEDAAESDSFKIRTDSINTRQIDKLTANDFFNKYSDIVISEIKPNGKSKSGVDQVLITAASSYYPKSKFETNFEMPAAGGESVVAENIPGQVQVKILDAKNVAELQQGAAVRAEDVEHFEINPSFLKGSPPVIINSSIIIPRPYINVVKIEYLPPEDIDSLGAKLLVEYVYNGRTYSEYILIFFSTSIRQSAEQLLAVEPLTNFRYLPKLRKVPPVHINETHFTYEGALPLNIVGVEYDFDQVGDDNRFINVKLLVQYRTVVIKLLKRLEFQYSKNEYINGAWTKARTENASITFDKAYMTPDVFYAKMDVETGEYTKTAELIKAARISSEYPYDSIRDIKVINFDRDSKIVYMKIIAIEKYGTVDVERVFEKQTKLKWTYNEWILGRVTDADVKLDPSKMPDFPNRKISQEIFLDSKDFKVLSIQYTYPGDDVKELVVQAQLVAGARSRYITKTINFKMTFNDYQLILKQNETINVLRSLKATDLSLLVDLEQVAPDVITPQQVVGAPEGVEVIVHYKPPKSGERSTRIIVELLKEKFSVGFEQTLLFGKNR